MVNGTWKAAAQDLLGCAVGHVGWFMRDVWTREMVGRSTILSDAPDALYVSYRSLTSATDKSFVSRKRLFGDI